MSEMKKWVINHMKPIDACMSAIDKANQYDDPQTAWDRWDDGSELLWTIVQMKYDRPTLIRCVCEIADHVLETYEKKYPGNDRPRQAIEAARRVAEEDTEENRDAAYAASRTAAYAADAAYSAYSAYAAARTAAYTADAAYSAYSAYAAARRAAYAAAYAAADSADAADAADAEERAWQANCVRRYFPRSPFLMEAKESDDNNHVC